MAAILEEIKRSKPPKDCRMRYYRYELLKRAYKAKLSPKDWEWFCKQIAEHFKL